VYVGMFVARKYETGERRNQKEEKEEKEEEAEEEGEEGQKGQIGKRNDERKGYAISRTQSNNLCSQTDTLFTL